MSRLRQDRRRRSDIGRVLLHAAQRRSLQNVSTSVLVVNSALACNGIATAHSLLNGAASSGVQPNHA